MSTALPAAVAMRDVVKRFPGVLANDRVTFEVEPGEIHGLLGENGAGKTTLMNVLSGLYHPDAGEVRLHGQRVDFESPRDALAAGVGMVHQHFMLIPRFTVAENLTLGAEVRRRGLVDRAAAEALVADLSEKYGLRVDPRAKVADISVGAQQRVEILKALYRGARVLILDEPTSVLTPQEVEELYQTMDGLRKDGHTLIFISHKLHEVLRLTDRITVLRDGSVVGTRNTAETTANELAHMMVGREVLLSVEKHPHTPGEVVLSVENLAATDNRGLPALRGLSFQARAGEIVGVAGIEGNGQTQLVEVLSGLRRPSGGQIWLDGRDVTDLTVANRFRQGMAHIPEDRHGRGLILDFSLAENAILGFQDDLPFAEGPRLNRSRVQEFAQRLMAEFDIRTPDATAVAGTLSGGNQQKLVLAREFQRRPRLILAAQPTRGLDVGATEFIHSQLLREREQGTAVLLVSLELSEIMSLSDHILVLYEGRLVGECRPEAITEEALGLMMAGGEENA